MVTEDISEGADLLKSRSLHQYRRNTQKMVALSVGTIEPKGLNIWFI